MQKTYVYIIIDATGRHAKVGVARSIERRLAQMQTGNAYKLRLKKAFECNSRLEAFELERAIHNIFKKEGGGHIHGEWFRWDRVNHRYKKQVAVLKLKEWRSTKNQPTTTENKNGIS